MTSWTPRRQRHGQLSSVTFIQGLGMGLVFVPMNLVAFATLAPQFRTDGAGLTNLMRNIGRAIGVSVTTTHPGQQGPDHSCPAVGLCRAIQSRPRRQWPFHDDEPTDSFRHWQF